ncbi:hypothetical protein GCM10027570_29240 [Streptomonospora sediminis]
MPTPSGPDAPNNRPRCPLTRRAARGPMKEKHGGCWLLLARLLWKEGHPGAGAGMAAPQSPGASPLVGTGAAAGTAGCCRLIAIGRREAVSRRSGTGAGPPCS